MSTGTTIHVDPTAPRRNLDQMRSIVPRIADSLPNGATLASTLHALIAEGEKTIQRFDKLARSQAWTPEGLEYARAEALAAAESDLMMAVTARVQNDQDHLAQIDAELAHVPQPASPFAAMFTWQRLADMPAEEQNRVISRTTDPEFVAAVVHAPVPFAFGSSDARQRMMAGFNLAHRREQAEMQRALRDRIDAVRNFRDAVMRELREKLR